jgi:adenylate kinase family enzyme
LDRKIATRYNHRMPTDQPRYEIPPKSPSVEDSNLKRVIVVGTSCAGKSTFASSLATVLQSPHVEYDRLYWQPGWTPRDRPEFITAVEQAISCERWVVDGNYGFTRDLVWPRATNVVWLNYSFPLVFTRAMKRTMRRVLTGEPTHAGNRESIRHAFLSSEGIPWWVVRSYRPLRSEYRKLRASQQYGHIQWTVLRRPSDAQDFLAQLANL